MPKEILAIKEAQNKGKTNTINLLYREILNFYKPNNPLVNSVIENIVRAATSSNKTDISIVIEISTTTNNNYIIGIKSDADNLAHTINNCKFFDNHKCNICITACRTRGETVKELEKYAKKNNFNIRYYQTTRVDNPKANKSQCDIENAKTAKIMLSNLKIIIK